MENKIIEKFGKAKLLVVDNIVDALDIKYILEQHHKKDFDIITIYNNGMSEYHISESDIITQIYKEL